ncbi:MAG: glycosyltransferase family protein [Desulfobacterales bacterium]|nr:glycosyltransferase family protein [Desulfobacterales bacterium]
MSKETRLLDIALQYHQRGNLKQAKAIYAQILSQSPEDAEALHLLGVACYQEGDYESSIGLIYKAISINPLNYHFFINMGNVLQEFNRFEDAVSAYKKALSLNPTDPMIYNNLGNALQNLGMMDKAIKVYNMSLRINPTSATTYNNLGTGLKAKSMFEEAVLAYKESISLSNDFAEAHDNLGKILLLLGDFREGFLNYEWRLKHPSFLKVSGLGEFEKPMWDGSPFHGKRLLVHYEQGFGDTINFIRYLPMVKERGGDVSFVCQPPLEKLFANFPGIDLLHTVEETIDLNYDFYIPLLSLPYIFNTTLATIPASIPYIKPDKELSLKWHNRLIEDHKLKVGIVWASNSKNYKLRNRSIGLKAFTPLFDVDGISLYSLQKGPEIEEIKYISSNMKLIDYTNQINDFSDTAAFIDNLDLVISVDTAVAHLAGAMAKNVWLLLQKVPDWRWLLDKEDSPWYPTMRIFRQQEDRDWNSVIRSVKDALCNRRDARPCVSTI